MTAHLSMEQLVALRDDDRSEPGLAEAQRHFAGAHAARRSWIACTSAPPGSARCRSWCRPATSFPPCSSAWRSSAVSAIGARQPRSVLAAAAALVLTVIGRDIVHPTRLDAEQQLQTAMSKSAQLEQRLRDWNSDQRVIDGQTAIVVIQLEDKIADLDARLQVAAKHLRSAPTAEELKLWQQRVGLMNALVDVHLTNASSVGL